MKRSVKAVACPYCQGVSAYLLSSTDVNRKTTTEVFDFYQCSICDIVFLSPMPDDMGPFYKGGYQAIPKDLAGLRAVAKGEHYRMSTILKYKQSGKLLEIGPWMGIFSCNAKDAGFDVTAIEMNPECVNFLNSIVGVRAIQSSDPAATMNAMEDKFDVIALWHSLEHLPEPWLVVQKAAERLAPDGILIIAVPNVESFDFSVMKQNWVHLDAPRHLFLYPAHSLEKLCVTIGLQTLDITASDQLSRILSLNAWSERAAKYVPLKYIRRIAGWVLYQLSRLRNNSNGSGITAIFVNPV